MQLLYNGMHRLYLADETFQGEGMKWRPTKVVCYKHFVMWWNDLSRVTRLRGFKNSTIWYCIGAFLLRSLGISPQKILNTLKGATWTSVAGTHPRKTMTTKCVHKGKKEREKNINEFMGRHLSLTHFLLYFAASTYWAPQKGLQIEALKSSAHRCMLTEWWFTYCTPMRSEEGNSHYSTTFKDLHFSMYVTI